MRHAEGASKLGCGVPSEFKVLHVIESFGAGSAAAVVQYAQSTPDLAHHLLYRPRGAGHDIHVPDGVFVHSVRWSRSRLRAWWEFRRIVRKVEPDVIHAHSSFAGLIVRTRTSSRLGSPPIVYTPHCFAFERRDLSFVTRLVLRFVEAILGVNTDALAACSLREAELARGLRTVPLVQVVPNVSRLAPAERNSAAGPPSIVLIGRIGAQKSPLWAAEFAGNLKALNGDVGIRWLGDGDPHMKQVLVDRGVSVDGWVDKEAVLAALLDASVYVHTAAWEGFPLSLLEANAAGIPIVARRIPAFAGAPDLALADSPDQLAAMVSRILSSRTSRASNIDAWTAFLGGNSRPAQAESLTSLYMRVTSPSAPVLGS